MAETTEEMSTGVEVESEKPKRRARRSTKSAAETAAVGTDVSEGAEAKAAPAQEGDEKPAPARRTRTSRAKAAKVEDAAGSSEQSGNPKDETAGEQPEKPKRTRSRKTVIDTSSEAKDGSDASTSSEGKASGEKAADGKGQDAKRAKQTQQRQGERQNNRQNNRRNRRNRRDREIAPSVTREELAGLKVAELRERAAELELDVAGLKKAELVEAVFVASVKAEGFLEVEGVLDILSDGYGFLRTNGYLPSESDCYVGTSLIKRNGLRKGDYICGQTRPARENEKFAAIQKITTVNGTPLEELGNRPRFADLTPIYPCDRLVMEHGKNTTTARVIDLVAPIGKGQRGLIVSPPKAGKTTILKDIAASISANNPEVHLMCLLVDERPEEVTDMQRSIKGEVISSTFDMPADNHIAVAEMVIERAKRLVERGEDVVILLDSITRLARAYNLAQPASGRVLSGGVDSTALYPPKRFLGAARNIEHGGSLTILASALIETGSKMDEVIFEEFKGTGNMELRLDRQLADRRIFPAIDPVASGTRKEELLLDSQMAPLIWAVRRLLANLNNTERAMDMLIKSIRQTDDNTEFLLRTARKAQHSKTETLEL